jgi:hypothetical protein
MSQKLGLLPQDELHYVVAELNFGFEAFGLADGETHIDGRVTERRNAIEQLHVCPPARTTFWNWDSCH